MKKKRSQMRQIRIIAEAGVNHNGQIGLAKKMIDIAADAKADAIKFQAWKAERLVTRFAGKAHYQKQMTNPDESQLDMLKQFELSFNAEKELFRYCKKKGIDFICSPFDMESIDFLSLLGVDEIKVPSGEITNLPFLRKLGGLGKKIILSTGMSKLGEIENALDILNKAGTKSDRIILLHCNTEYPTPMEDVNLKCMKTISAAFPDIQVGYSDHTLGIEIPIAAAALGAVIIEKHFTLDRNMEGPDHKASLEPSELRSMINAIRNIEIAMGTGIKKPSSSEKKNISIARKSIVAQRDIEKGEIFSEDNICVKRPGDGMNPMLWDEVIGKHAQRSFTADEFIE